MIQHSQCVQHIRCCRCFLWRMLCTTNHPWNSRSRTTISCHQPMMQNSHHSVTITKYTRVLKRPLKINTFAYVYPLFFLFRSQPKMHTHSESKKNTAKRNGQSGGSKISTSVIPRHLYIRQRPPNHIGDESVQKTPDNLR